jgi:hypothetical protein
MTFQPIIVAVPIPNSQLQELNYSMGLHNILEPVLVWPSENESKTIVIPKTR